MRLNSLIRNLKISWEFFILLSFLCILSSHSHFCTLGTLSPPLASYEHGSNASLELYFTKDVPTDFNVIVNIVNYDGLVINETTNSILQSCMHLSYDTDESRNVSSVGQYTEILSRLLYQKYFSYTFHFSFHKHTACI